MGTKYIDRVKELCSHVSFYISQMLLIMKSVFQNYRFEGISMKHQFPSSLYFTIEFYEKLHSNDIFHYRLLHGILFHSKTILFEKILMSHPYMLSPYQLCSTSNESNEPHLWD